MLAIGCLARVVTSVTLGVPGDACAAERDSDDAAATGATAETATSGDLTALSLEELMSLPVTSVSRRPEPRLAAPAPIYVITEEDIRRAGVTTLADALRLAPGMQVARITANQWAVGVRGFGTRLARSILVLIDGRSVYTPLFAGTYWEVQDTLLEDIDRIEIIRGPGGAIWGANAVNGVINIITKSAQATHGALVSAGGGNEERGFGGARYGGVIGDDFHYRVYSKYFDRDGGFNPNGRSFDDWHMTREGFRTDWNPTARDHVQFQGDIYDGDAGEQEQVTQLTPPTLRTVTQDAELAGGNLLARWRRVFSSTADIALAMYYDNTFRREAIFSERRNTYDVDFQNHLVLPFDQNLVWGSEYRHTGDRTGGGPTLVFTPKNRGDDLFTTFVQDEIPLWEGVRLTLGSKFEHNDYSGFEWQPSGRISWAPDARQMLWAGVSRAVRTPSRIEHDLSLTAALPGSDAFARLLGDDAFVSEKVIAYEAGHRVQVLPQLFVDTALFYNQYSDLLTVEPQAPFTEPGVDGSRTIMPFVLRNRLHGESYGIEVAADAALTDWWRLHGAYSLLKIELRRDPGSRDFSHQPIEGSSPRHQVVLRSTMNLPYEAQFDGVLRYVDHLPAQHVGSYVTLDLRVAKQVTRALELSVVGLNLAQDHHREFGGGTEVQRSVYGQVRWRW